MVNLIWGLNCNFTYMYMPYVQKSLVLHRASLAKTFSVKLVLSTYLSFETCVLGDQTSRLIETVLLSTHNICFGWEIRK